MVTHVQRSSPASRQVCPHSIPAGTQVELRSPVQGSHQSSHSAGHQWYWSLAHPQPEISGIFMTVMLKDSNITTDEVLMIPD